MAYFDAGRLDDALTEFHTALRLSPGWSTAQAGLGAVYARTGRRAEALAILNHLLRQSPRDPGSEAMLLVQLGEPDRALDALEGAQPGSFYLHVLGSPMLAPLRAQPRFLALLQRIGLRP